MNLIFEASATPVYQRLIDRIVEALSVHFECLVAKESLANLFEINRLHLDYNITSNSIFIITNIHHSLNQTTKDGIYYFEKINNRFIYLYHDPLSHVSDDFEVIIAWIEALQRNSDRISHITIEPGDQALLRSLGLNAKYHPHIPSLTWELSDPPLNTEATTSSSWEGSYSFVGHFSPQASIDTRIQSSQLLSKCANLKFQYRNFKVRPSLVLDKETKSKDYVIHAAEVIRMLRTFGYFSNTLRIHTLASIKNFTVSVFGGIPGQKSHFNAEIFSSINTLRFFDPVWNDADTHKVFRESLAIINITSTSIDYPLTNRLYDVSFAGGLPITDFKDEVTSLASDFRYVSYVDGTDLLDKLDHIKSLTVKTRTELILSLQRSLASHSSKQKLQELFVSIASKP